MFCPLPKNMKGSPYPHKKKFIRSFDIMKRSAKYKDCGIIHISLFSYIYKVQNNGYLQSRL